MTEQKRPTKCPTCGKGDLVDITFREGGQGAGDEPIQTAETWQVESYSCGHEVSGPRLDQTASGSGELDAERRRSEETTDRP